MLGSLSIVIPVFNSEQSLPSLLARLNPLPPSPTQRSEGRALLVNHPELVDRAEILREKGTDRS